MNEFTPQQTKTNQKPHTHNERSIERIFFVDLTIFFRFNASVSGGLLRSSRVSSVAVNIFLQLSGC